MKSLIIAALAVSGAAVAAPAFAQDAVTYPTWNAPQGYLNLGYTQTSPSGHDIGEVTGRAGLRMGRYWGVEGEFGGGVSDHSFTTPGGASGKVSEGFSPAGYAVGYLPLMNGRVDLLGRVGYGETTLKTSTPAATHVDTYTSLNYGAGAQYFFTHNDGIRVDWTRRDYQTSTAPKDDDTWAVSYVRRF